MELKLELYQQSAVVCALRFELLACALNALLTVRDSQACRPLLHKTNSVVLLMVEFTTSGMDRGYR